MKGIRFTPYSIQNSKAQAIGPSVARLFCFEVIRRRFVCRLYEALAYTCSVFFRLWDRNAALVCAYAAMSAAAVFRLASFMSPS
ncbi:hypothetical protein [Paraburkholderia sp. Ac-20347]|uniref:hypothetical protein n=1 Tax=Paraburkholderia sp. Ac-20347 TaxID=2703892 RepID=UPI00197DE16C|nr:hypothetical protein [Paraburkholderia sp. Ac-20347]MBN3809750.1 hypothetical protein [Paraburkholderia sp. Ac-20347]